MKMDLLDDFPEEIDKELLRELFTEYTGIKRSYYTQNFELTLTRLGRFIETLFMLLSVIALKKKPKQLKINVLQKELENLSEDDQNSSIRIIIPRIAYSLYTIRSKRGSVHKDFKISPNEIDSKFVFSCCNWILCEIIRLYLKKDTQNIIKILDEYSKIPIPFIEDINGELVLLKPELPLRDQILVYLLNIYPKAANRVEIIRFARFKTANQFNSVMHRLRLQVLIHENDGQFYLTANGVNEAENVVFSTNRIPKVAKGR